MTLWPSLMVVPNSTDAAEIFPFSHTQELPEFTRAAADCLFGDSDDRVWDVDVLKQVRAAQRGLLHSIL